MENLEHSKAAQLAATFSISMFLSLCVLVQKDIVGWDLILRILWTASGLFGAAAMKYVDAVFDSNIENNTDKSPFIALLSLNDRHLISIDERWKNIGFIMYFFAWLFFIAAFFLVGFQVFNIDNPSNIMELLEKHTWFVCVAICVFFSTAFAATYDFLFIR